MLIRPSRDTIHRLVRVALEEDAPWGDVTSQSLIPASAHATARLVARELGVLSGEDVFTAAMSLTDPSISTRFHLHDAEPFTEATVLATIEGPAQAVLQAERVALNFLQRMSGIATQTAQYVSAVAGTRARIVDTRKTTPGLRLIERYAVRCGGGGNLTEALQSMRARLPHTTHIEVEVDRPEQIEAVLSAGVDTILLDNFTTAQLSLAVAHIAGRALVEASGGITLARIREIADTGVDIISVGALTHSIRSLDLGLDILPR